MNFGDKTRYKDDKAEGPDLDILNIEEAECAIMELTGSVPECIHNGWKYAMGLFLQSMVIFIQDSRTLNIIMKGIWRAKAIKWNCGFP